MSADTGQLEVARSMVEQKEQRLAGEVQALTRQCDGARETLERLDGYLAEYAGADRAAAAGGQRSLQIANARGFVGRLHQAIGEQRRQLERLSERTEHKTAQWQRLRADLTAIDRLIERRRGEARRGAARREQREQDASAARARHAHSGPAGADPRGTEFTTLRTEHER